MKKPNVRIDRAKMEKIAEATQSARVRAGLVPAAPHPVAAPKLSETPCPRCLALAQEGAVRAETVQRLPEGVGVAPLHATAQASAASTAPPPTRSRVEWGSRS